MEALMARPSHTAAELALVLQQLSRAIPTPPPRRAKPAKSKLGCKPGDCFMKFNTLLQRNINAEVIQVDSLTVTLRDTTGLVIQVSSKEQLSDWKHVPKSRRKKVAPVEQQPTLPLSSYDTEPGALTGTEPVPGEDSV